MLATFSINSPPLSESEETLLLELGLLKDGRLTESAGAALWACDEKGLESTDGKVKFHRAAAPKVLGKVTTDVASSSWGHVTLLPFVSLRGDVGPPNVILQGSCRMKSWSTVWPEANITANEKASCTADLFCQFLLIWAKHCREVLKVPASQQLVLICDSGGGSLIHLSTDCTLLCHQLGVRLFLLGPYLTRAVMCLDQTPNSEAERRWQKIRREGMPASQLEVLDASHEIWDAGYCPDHIRSGWKQIGLAHKCAVNRNVVLVDRAPQLFRKTLSVEELAVEQPESQALLQRPQGYTRGKCMVACETCSKQTPSSLPLCGHCGSKNSHFSPVKAAIAVGAKSGGYSRKTEALADVQSEIDKIEPATKAHLSKFSGDVLGQMRKRKTAEKETQPAVEPAQPSKKQKVPELVPTAPPAVDGPSSSKAASQPPPEEEEEPSEFDLEDVASAVQYLALHWAKPNRTEELRTVLEFYVSHLKNKSTKAMPLSLQITSEIIDKKALHKVKDRESFLKCWKSKRSQRFAPKPKFLT